MGEKQCTPEVEKVPSAIPCVSDLQGTRTSVGQEVTALESFRCQFLDIHLDDNPDFHVHAARWNHKHS